MSKRKPVPRKRTADSQLAYRRYQLILQTGQVTITSVARLRKITIVRAEQRHGELARDLHIVFHGNRERPTRVLGGRFHKVDA